MANNSDIGFGNLGWFRWVPPAILLMAALTPALYMLFYYVVMQELGPKYWSWGQLIVSLLLLIAPILSVTNPFIGGIIAVIIVPILLFGYALMAGMAGLSREGELFLSILVTLFIIGGILSIIHGIRCWLRRRSRREQV